MGMTQQEESQEYTLEQYKRMANRFNSKTFAEKLTIIKNYPKVLHLCNDGNWWRVKAANSDIQYELEEEDHEFKITNEWGVYEMETLIDLFGISCLYDA